MKKWKGNLWLSELINHLKELSPRSVYKKGVLKHFSKSTRTHLCLRTFFGKGAIKWHTKMVNSKMLLEGHNCWYFRCFFIIASLLCTLNFTKCTNSHIPWRLNPRTLKIVEGPHQRAQEIILAGEYCFVFVKK